MTIWEKVRHQVAISGRVKNAQTDRGVANARVEVSSGPAAYTSWLASRAIQFGDRWEKMPERPDRKYTFPDGHFHFMDLPDGDYTLTVSLPNSGTRFGTARQTVTVGRDGRGNLVVSTAEVALPPTTLYGRITAQDTGVGIALANVRLMGSGEHAFTDSQGNFLLTGLEAGPAQRTVEISARGYKPASKTIQLHQAGTVQTMNITLLHTTLLHGLKLWLKAETFIGMGDGDPIDVWPDKCGGGCELLQSTNASKPTYRQGVVNGLPIVRFDGVDDYLACELGSRRSWTGDFSLFIVAAAEVLSQPTGSSIFSSFSNFGTGSTINTFQIDISGSSPRRYRYNSSGKVRIGDVSTAFMLLVCVLSGTTLDTYCNGSSTRTKTLNFEEGNHFFDYLLGVDRNGDRFFRGDIAEVMLYEHALSDIARQAVEGYLSTRFALTAG